MIDRAHLEAKRGEHTHYVADGSTTTQWLTTDYPVVPATGEKRCCLCLSIWPCEQSQILDLALSAEGYRKALEYIRDVGHDHHDRDVAGAAL